MVLFLWDTPFPKRLPVWPFAVILGATVIALISLIFSHISKKRKRISVSPPSIINLSIAKNSFVRLKVKVEFRKDISSSDLPTQSETLNFSFTIKYVQSDENGTSVRDDGVKKAYRVVSGDLDTVGSEICIDTECFYVIASDENSVTTLAKYNLYVGNDVYYDETTSKFTITPYDNPTGLQDSTMKCMPPTGNNPRNGCIMFSKTMYWCTSNCTGNTAKYVYDSNSTLYVHVENYKDYLENLGLMVEEARLITSSEVTNLGCVYNQGCYSAPEWLYSTSYWTGTSLDFMKMVYAVRTHGSLTLDYYDDVEVSGVRPVIKFAK